MLLSVMSNVAVGLEPPAIDKVGNCTGPLKPACNCVVAVLLIARPPEPKAFT